MAKQIREQRGSRNIKIRSQRNGVNRAKNSPFKNRIKNRPITAKPKMQDARQKIIQKKRKVTDARDVLTKMAKTHDARSKLDKMRSVRSGIVNKVNLATPLNPKVKVIGNSILQRIDRNGKISLVTNKPRNTSDINFAIKKQLGLIPQSRPEMKRFVPSRRSQLPRNPAPIRKTIINNMDYRVPLDSAVPDYNRDNPNLFKWVKPDLRPASHLISSLEPTRQAMRDVMREELLLASRGWSNMVTPKTISMQPSGYIDLDAVDEDEPMVVSHPTASRISLQGSARMSNVHSRLDSIPSQPTSHGIFSHTKTKVVVPAGHRIVVSNLQSSVTEDDIKELFEDIGQLLSAKLVRPGVAEVIYKILKDAQKAVDTYHNRQLDGQPMKCLLVNKRPLNQPTAAPLPKSEVLVGRQVSSVNSANKLVPDINTIHKVLFQRK